MSRPLLARRCGAEALGAALIVLADLGSAHLSRLGLLPEPLATVAVPGATVLVLIYTFSDLSGAHFNPAVSLAFALRGSFSWRELPAYLAAHLFGAVSAALLLSLHEEHLLCLLTLTDIWCMLAGVLEECPLTRYRRWTWRAVTPGLRAFARAFNLSEIALTERRMPTSRF